MQSHWQLIWAARRLPAASDAIVAYRRQSRQASGSAPSLLALACHLPQPSRTTSVHWTHTQELASGAQPPAHCRLLGDARWFVPPATSLPQARGAGYRALSFLATEHPPATRPPGQKLCSRRSVRCQQTLCGRGAAGERGAAACARLASRKLPSAPSCGAPPRAAGPAAGASPSAAAARAPSSLLTRCSIWRSVQATAVLSAQQHSQAPTATGTRPCRPAAASGDLACRATHITGPGQHDSRQPGACATNLAIQWPSAV